ncbi:MAG: hypothetical protein PHP08_00535 [Candidatus Dojkabacteria bacterium]|nr:hypothetical protein [Candidatus Dojkabacteria bacterium]
MNTLILIVIAIIWIASGILSHGMYFGYFQYKYPRLAEEHYKQDMRDSIFFALFGPINLIAALLITTKIENRRLKLQYKLKFK